MLKQMHMSQQFVEHLIDKDFMGELLDKKKKKKTLVS